MDKPDVYLWEIKHAVINLRAQYMLDMKVFDGHADVLIFIDETCADQQDVLDTILEVSQQFAQNL